MSISILPGEIADKIVSSLEVFDVCSLGSCSRFWRERCGSDCVWEALCKDRWPGLSVDSNSKGWRGLYISKHSQMAEKADFVTNFVERALDCALIGVGDYLRAIKLLNLLGFGFKDVRMFFFKPKLNVLLNLVGLHYCIVRLGVPAEYVIEALDSNQVSERRVCVRWLKLGRWFYLRDRYHHRCFSLGKLAGFNKEILGMLDCGTGAIHEATHVQICAASPTHTYRG